MNKDKWVIKKRSLKEDFLIFLLGFIVAITICLLMDKTPDPVIITKTNNDSLVKVISAYQDSLLQKKDCVIIKYKTRYETVINNIDTLSIDDNVKLLSRNLSENDSIK